MEDWNAQKMLDLYIHDYLVRKNMQTTADILAEEAGIEPKIVAINPSEGFLSEWWTMFWDTYSSRIPNNQGSSSQAPGNAGTFPALPDLPMPPTNMSEDELMALLMSQRLPSRNFDQQLASLLPLTTTSSRRQRKADSRRQDSVSNDAVSGPRARTIPTETTHAQRLTQEDLGHTDSAAAGRTRVEQNPSEGCYFPVLDDDDNLLLSDQQPLYSVPSARIQDTIFDELFAQASQNVALCAPDQSSTKMTTHINCDDDGSKKKGVQIERNTESGKPLDDDIPAFFSSDDASNSMNITDKQTSSRKKEELQDFPFGLVRSTQPSDNKLSCCDFSSQGKYLAAAGHEKKVFIWNVKQSSSNAIPIEAHSEIITDVRFKANSFMFATSSYDKTVKIWDAPNKRLIHNLDGHAEPVMSLDFHPKKTNILCSCDSYGHIKYWRVNESTCLRNIQGGNTQVRFQSRHGNFLAAAIGNVINLIDVETGTIQHRCEGHEEEVRTIGWDVCGENLVSVSQDSARVWSVALGGLGRCIHALASTARDFTSGTFHPAYSHVIVIGSYESIYIWNPSMRNRTWKFSAHEGIIPAMANAPETNMIASVGDDHCIKLWK